MFKLIIAEKKGNWKMYNINDEYLESGEQAFEKIRTVARFLNSAVGNRLAAEVKNEIILAILGIEEEEK